VNAKILIEFDKEEKIIFDKYLKSPIFFIGNSNMFIFPEIEIINKTCLSIDLLKSGASVSYSGRKNDEDEISLCE
jgi:hypothetical protein